MLRNVGLESNRRECDGNREKPLRKKPSEGETEVATSDAWKKREKRERVPERSAVDDDKGSGAEPYSEATVRKARGMRPIGHRYARTFGHEATRALTSPDNVWIK
jgi:hypothetical protein